MTNARKKTSGTISLPVTCLSCWETHSYMLRQMIQWWHLQVTPVQQHLDLSSPSWTSRSGYITAYLEAQHLLLCSTACGAVWDCVHSWADCSLSLPAQKSWHWQVCMLSISRLQRAYSSQALTWCFDIWSSTSSTASFVEAWSAICVQQTTGRRQLADQLYGYMFKVAASAALAQGWLPRCRPPKYCDCSSTRHLQGCCICIFVLTLLYPVSRFSAAAEATALQRTNSTYVLGQLDAASPEFGTNAVACKCLQW